jgi:hypothetical protein
MNKWAEILVGLILVIIAVYVWGINWLGFGESALFFLKGGLVWIVILVGFLFLLLGISDLRD